MGKRALPKVKRGQIWRKVTNGSLVQITGRARSKRGIKRYNTVRYDSATRVNHSMSAKELRDFYEHVTEAEVAHLKVNRPKYKGYNEFRKTVAERYDESTKAQAQLDEEGATT